MRKVGIVFLFAVILPSLVLAWLAIRSLRDQRFAIERQQFLLCQGVADGLAAETAERLETLQAGFARHVEELLRTNGPTTLANSFDQVLRRDWSLAEVGFAVNLTGRLLSPSPTENLAAQLFCRDNGAFLGNREIAQVYGNVAYNTAANPEGKNVFQTWNDSAMQQQQQSLFTNPGDSSQVTSVPSANQQQQSVVNLGKAQNRKVVPAQQAAMPEQAPLQQLELNYSKIIPAEAEFHQLIGDATDGMLARFLQNQLKVMFWHRAGADPNLVFGAQLNLEVLESELRQLIRVDDLLRDEICVALLDDNAKPVALSVPGFQSNWRRPFVASEISEALPHWEVGVYLLNPERLVQAARTAQLTLGLLIVVLMLAIGAGSWLIIGDVNRQLRLTRQKTDFVSNVSHELKTPLTSIRMFSELLAEGKITDREKQHSYLRIIAAESARLTRLINNVLDFARMERGEKKYNLRKCNVEDLLSETINIYEPHAESNGFRLDYHPPQKSVNIWADRDALAQVIMNLLSNAEKYSNGQKEITVQAQERSDPIRHLEIQVMDRGTGVPRGSEERIFEQFYRADDSLSSGVQGSGLGLTLARQIARAHGGDVTYAARPGGGSCFTLSLPLTPFPA